MQHTTVNKVPGPPLGDTMLPERTLVYKPIPIHGAFRLIVHGVVGPYEPAEPELFEHKPRDHIDYLFSNFCPLQPCAETHGPNLSRAILRGNMRET